MFRVLVIALCLSFLVVSWANGVGFEGAGEPGDPFLIYTAAQLNAIGADSTIWASHFRLMADIDLADYTGTQFNLIGAAGGGLVLDAAPPFSGVFDGNGFTISNFTYHTDGANIQPVGLFARVAGPDAAIYDLTLQDPCVVAPNSQDVGALVGAAAHAALHNCRIQGGMVSGHQRIGGLAGKIDNSTLTDCHTDTQVEGFFMVGGLTSLASQSHISNCSAVGVVDGTLYIGGLIGNLNAATVEYSRTAGSVSGRDNVGGLAGLLQGGSLTRCRAAAAVYAIASNAGGLAGLANNTAISESYATGAVTGFAESAGGLVGYASNLLLSDSYAAGSVQAARNTGGLLGELWGVSSLVANTYAIGAIDSSAPRGGLIAVNSTGAAAVTASFWDTQTTGLATSAGGAARNTAQMTTRANYTDAGWDFTLETTNGAADLWAIVAGQYPFLAWDTPFDGEGTAAAPFLIYTPVELNAVGALPHLWGAHFRVMADIDMTAYTAAQYNRIGRYATFADNQPFAGVFDGNGHTIANLTYAGNTPDAVGMFAYVSGPAAQVLNITLDAVNINAPSAQRVGALVGILGAGEVRDCSVAGAVAGQQLVGGLIGHNETGALLRCQAAATVTAADNGVGGLVGWQDAGSIDQSCALGGVVGNALVGGLLGYNDTGAVNDSYSSAAVHAQQFLAGGFVGLNNAGAIARCYANGPVSGGGNFLLGGFAADADTGAFTACFWDIPATGQNASAGGTGLTTALMRTRNTYVNAGWDCNGETANGVNQIWMACDGPHAPDLAWRRPTADIACGYGVDLADFSIMAANWGRDDCAAPLHCDFADVNRSGAVDMPDLAALADQWLSGQP